MSQDVFLPPDQDEIIAKVGAYAICQSSRGGVYAIDEEGQEPWDWKPYRVGWPDNPPLGCWHRIPDGEIAIAYFDGGCWKSSCLVCWAVRLEDWIEEES